MLAPTCSAFLSQGATLEFNDALTVVFDGLGSQHAALVIFKLTIELLRQLACSGNHHIKGLFGMTRPRQAEEEAHGRGAEQVDIIKIEHARFHGIGHGEQHFTVTRHAFMTVENIHKIQFGSATIEYRLEFQDRKNLNIKVYPDCIVKIILKIKKTSYK